MEKETLKKGAKVKPQFELPIFEYPKNKIEAEMFLITATSFNILFLGINKHINKLISSVKKKFSLEDFSFENRHK